MEAPAKWNEAGRGVVIFAACYVAAWIVLPLLGILLNPALPGTLTCLLFLMVCYMVPWNEGLRDSASENPTFYHSALIEWAPMIAFLLAGLLFGWFSRRMKPQWQFAVAFVVLLAVALMLHLAISIVGLRVVVTPL